MDQASGHRKIGLRPGPLTLGLPVLAVLCLLTARDVAALGERPTTELELSESERRQLAEAGLKSEPGPLLPGETPVIAVQRVDWGYYDPQPAPEPAVSACGGACEASVYEPAPAYVARPVYEPPREPIRFAAAGGPIPEVGPLAPAEKPVAVEYAESRPYPEASAEPAVIAVEADSPKPLEPLEPSAGPSPDVAVD